MKTFKMLHQPGQGSSNVPVIVEIELGQGGSPGKKCRLQLGTVQKISGQIQILEIWLVGQHITGKTRQGVVGQGEVAVLGVLEDVWREVGQLVVGDVQLHRLGRGDEH